MKKKSPQLIVALDVSSLAQVRELLQQLGDTVDIFKVGSQLFTACGPAAVRFVEAQGKRVFLDLKFHDIPNTVARAVESAVEISVALERSLDAVHPVPEERRGVFMYTLHTSGGVDMLRAAVDSGVKTAEKNALPRPLAVGVTVLTSQAKTDNILAQVLLGAEKAKQAGLDGVVASCAEAPMLRKEFGPDFVIVTPGIRPQGSEVQDQQRVATPQLAVKSGSDFLVVGRPIVQSSDPRQAALSILNEMT